jgi:hypothetical protein
MPDIETVRILPESEEQGNYILINAEDFDKKKHKIYDGPDNPPAEVPVTLESMAAELAEAKAKLAALSPPAEGADGWGAPPAA